MTNENEDLAATVARLKAENEALCLRVLPEGWRAVPEEPTPEIIAGAAIASWPTASAADIALALRAAPLVLMKLDANPGVTADMLAAMLATMAPAYRAMLAAAPLPPSAPAHPAAGQGWIKNEGWEPLIEAELRDGTLVAQEASAYAWEIDGEHEPGDILRCRVSFTAKRGFTDPLPVPEVAPTQQTGGGNE